MIKTTITKEEINTLELSQYEGKVVVIDRKESVPSAIQEIRQHKIVGFDSESKPVFVKGGYNPTALVQIAIPNKVFLFRVNKIGFVDGIKELMESKTITKLGIGLHDDLVDLRKSFQLNPNGFADLNEMVGKTEIQVKGVRKLAGLLLNIRISKGAQTSDWAAKVLTSKQIRYAATDAWVCTAIYAALQQKGYV